jgi:membrane-bound serine protease (ClpP class)
MRSDNKRLWLPELLAMMLGVAVLFGEEPKQERPAEPKQFARGVVIPIDGELTPMTESSFMRRLAEAKRLQADLLIVELDSPGGYVDTSLEIADALLRVDWARTVAFVPREAMSGAAIVALACDEIIIAPNAQFGDAGMIQLSLEEAGFRYAPEKARSALVSRVRTLAVAKGRPPALAEALVDMDLAVFRVRNKQTGAETFMSDAEINSAADPDRWEKLDPVFETRGKNFLTVNGTRAVELQLSQATARSHADLKTRYKLSSDFVVLQHTGVDTAVLILNHPLITGLIFVIGLVALYVEFSFPGTCIGGLIAGLCFAVFFWSRFLGGTAGWLEVILFVAGLTFIGMELFIIPGFGVAGITGVLLLIASVVMASQTFVIPHNSRQLDTTLTQVGIVGGSGILFVIAALFVSRYLGAIPVMKALVLEMPVPVTMAADGPTGTGLLAASAIAGMPVTVGEHGVTDSPLRPAGKARFGDRFVDVVSDGVFVDRNTPVRVIEIAGNRVVVREVDTRTTA